MELDHSIKHAFIGSYKAAFADLRRAIELTLLNAFFTSDYSEREVSLEWLLSQRDTPFFSTMLEKLTKAGRFKKITETHNWKQNIKQVYWNISDFAHNKGRLKSYRELNKIDTYISGTFISKINTETLSQFLDSYIETVSEIVVILLLYNPVILVGLPIEEKFGLNGPMSGYYNEYESKIIRQLVPDKYIEFFDSLIIEDEEVKEIVREINSLPDISEDDLKNQAQRHRELWQKNDNSAEEK